MIPNPVVTKSGFIDFDSRNPLLEEEDGTVWRLEGDVAFEDIPMGADAEVSGVVTGPLTFSVLAFRLIETD